MQLRYDDADEAFRRELVTWLEASAPSPSAMSEAKRSSAHMPDWARAWQRRLFDHGWLVPGWPPELGGRNATPVQQMIYFEEMARLEVPRTTNPQGLGIVAPSILDHGTEEQRARFAVPTLRAEISWCIGMSEPGAGSDLAALSTRAEVREDDFLVNGQKVWTSGAHDADWCLCYVRTNPRAPKHRGISAIIIDMRTPGVTCRPLPELTEADYADFNEVFFTDVVVPRENLLGELDEGWPITQSSLAHERAMLWIGHAQNLQRSLQSLIAAGQREDGRGRRLRDDPRFRDRLASLYIDTQAVMLLGYRGFAKHTRGKPAPEHALLKLFGSETQRRLFLAGMNSLGAHAVDRDLAGPPILRSGSWADQYLRSFAATIAGGTSEIQRNIIAERVLGLPRS